MPKQFAGFSMVKLMIDLLSYFRNRRIKKNRIICQKALLELNSLTVTIHGRLALTKVCLDPDNGLPDEIKRIYWVLMGTAPVRNYAERN